MYRFWVCLWTDSNWRDRVFQNNLVILAESTAIECDRRLLVNPQRYLLTKDTLLAVYGKATAASMPNIDNKRSILK